VVSFLFLFHFQLFHQSASRPENKPKKKDETENKSEKEKKNSEEETNPKKVYSELNIINHFNLIRLTGFIFSNAFTNCHSINE
jgi:hypothetical protein